MGSLLTENEHTNLAKEGETHDLVPKSSVSAGFVLFVYNKKEAKR